MRTATFWFTALSSASSTSSGISSPMGRSMSLAAAARLEAFGLNRAVIAWTNAEVRIGLEVLADGRPSAGPLGAVWPNGYNIRRGHLRSASASIAEGPSSSPPSTTSRTGGWSNRATASWAPATSEAISQRAPAVSKNVRSRAWVKGWLSTQSTTPLRTAAGRVGRPASAASGAASVWIVKIKDEP